MLLSRYLESFLTYLSATFPSLTRSPRSNPLIDYCFEIYRKIKGKFEKPPLRFLTISLNSLEVLKITHNSLEVTILVIKTIKILNEYALEIVKFFSLSHKAPKKRKLKHAQHHKSTFNPNVYCSKPSIFLYRKSVPLSPWSPTPPIPKL